VARLVAQQLGYTYIDSGAMYRALTWRLLNLGVDVHDHQQVADAIKSIRVELQPSSNNNAVIVDGIDVTGLIRSPEVSRQTPVVAAQRAVRAHLLHEQQRMAAGGGVVMDGRDIGTIVLPNAELKIFLTASLAERTARRGAELGISADDTTAHAAIQREIEQRDQADRQRTVSPLRQAEGALLIDTTGMSIDAEVKSILTAAHSIH